MSLTSHLEDPESPIGQFFPRRFPQVAPLIAQAQQPLKAVRTFRPADSGPDYPYGLVGMAIDYRLRYYFDVTPKEQLVAWLGARLLVSGERSKLPRANLGDDREAMAHYDPEVIGSFFAGLDATLARISPVGRKLAETDERELARYCFVLACLEVPYRAERWKFGPLVVPTVKKSAAELLAIPNKAIIDDICRLSVLFHARYSGLLTRAYALNPTFAGSGDVGGADADLIVSQCLIDLKTTTYPALKGQWLYQVLGYVLLDYEDSYHLEWVAIYMARQGKLLAWKLADLLPTLTGDPEITVQALREELLAIIQQHKSRPRDTEGQALPVMQEESPQVWCQRENARLRQQRQHQRPNHTEQVKRIGGEPGSKPPWITLSFQRRANGAFKCQLTSNVPLDRGEDYYDMKVYLKFERVYEQFWAATGLPLSIDVYENDGEYCAHANLNVTEKTIEVIEVSPELALTVVEEAGKS